MSLCLHVGGSSSINPQSLLEEIDPFNELQHFPHLFEKGGTCYEEVMRTYGNTLTDNMHLQFQEMKNIIFRFNKKAERLEVCLGTEHIPVGPLTPHQRELTRLAAAGSQHKSAGSSSAEEHHSVKWLVNKPSATASVKAFSGTGHTLGGGGGGGGGGASSGGATIASGGRSLHQTQAQVRMAALVSHTPHRADSEHLVSQLINVLHVHLHLCVISLGSIADIADTCISAQLLLALYDHCGYIHSVHEVAFQSPLKAFAPILCNLIATSGLTQVIFLQDQ